MVLIVEMVEHQQQQLQHQQPKTAAWFDIAVLLNEFSSSDTLILEWNQQQWQQEREEKNPITEDIRAETYGML